MPITLLWFSNFPTTLLYHNFGCLKVAKQKISSVGNSKTWKNLSLSSWHHHQLHSISHAPIFRSPNCNNSEIMDPIVFVWLGGKLRPFLRRPKLLLLKSCNGLFLLLKSWDLYCFAPVWQLGIHEFLWTISSSI